MSHAPPADPTLADVYAARRRASGFYRHTPLVPSASLSQALGADVRLKLETLQDTGAFKVRGASNAILSLPAQRRERGVVTYSTGNHGRAVAWVAERLGIPATICVSELVTEQKIAALERFRCTLSVEGRSQDEAAARAFRMAREQGLAAIDPINDPAIIAGHGTAGLELLEDFAGIDAAIVPVSGGALACGIARVLKSARPGCRVLGVSMDRGAAMHASLRAGHPVEVPEVQSLADSLQGGILLDNRHTFRMVRELVDDIVLVDEERIREAMAHAWWQERLVLEGAAATPVAALLQERRALAGRSVALLLTGRSVDADRFVEIAREHRDAAAANLRLAS